ncbi:MAG: hypothetical protein AAFX94_20955, partial [Myxococcota bacterium]
MVRATLTAGIAVSLLQWVSLRWTPDCGGVAYGFPLPFRATSVVSSLEMHYFLVPLILDLLFYYGLASVGVVALAARLFARCPPWFARTVATTVLVPSLLLAAHLTLEMVAFGLVSLSPTSLYVYEWREVTLHLGWQVWDR